MKRRKIEDPTCLFCNEQETIYHLFFDCVVSKQLWHIVSGILSTQLGGSLDNIGQFWLSNERNCIINMCTSAVCWSLWKLRNDMCFQRKMWKSMAMLIHSMVLMLQNWVILCPAEKKDVLLNVVAQFRKEASQVL